MKGIDALHAEYIDCRRQAESLLHLAKSGSPPVGDASAATFAGWLAPLFDQMDMAVCEITRRTRMIGGKAKDTTWLIDGDGPCEPKACDEAAVPVGDPAAHGMSRTLDEAPTHIVVSHYRIPKGSPSSAGYPHRGYPDAAPKKPAA